jgi:RNase P/RNase MRP subunit p30
MSGQGKRKRKGQCAVAKSPSPRGAMDLFVPLPSSRRMHHILPRFLEYQCVALTHVVRGRPKDPEDRAATTIPDDCFEPKQGWSDLLILKRLHLVIDNISDMAMFSLQASALQQLMEEYDLVSIAPCTDEVFQSACTCTGVDIVTLDGSISSSSNKLPYSIRSTDVREIRKRNAILEVPYAQPVLSPTARKGWIQTCRSVISASMGGEGTPAIPILCSSGSRVCSVVANGSGTTSPKTDVGAIAIHTPGDLVNLFHTVLGLDSKSATNAITKSGQIAIDHAKRRRRRHGYQDTQFPSLEVAGVGVEQASDRAVGPPSLKVLPAVTQKDKQHRRLKNDDDSDEGFIAF